MISPVTAYAPIPEMIPIMAAQPLYFSALSRLKFNKSHLVIVPINAFKTSKTTLTNICINSVLTATLMSE